MPHLNRPHTQGTGSPATQKPQRLNLQCSFTCRRVNVVLKHLLHLSQVQMGKQLGLFLELRLLAKNDGWCPGAKNLLALLVVDM